MDIPDFQLIFKDPESVKEEFVMLEAARLSKYYFNVCDTKEKQYKNLLTAESRQEWAEKMLVNTLANIVVVTQTVLNEKWDSETQPEHVQRLADIIKGVMHISMHNAEFVSMLLHMKYEREKALADIKEVEELSKLYAKPTS